MFIQKKKSISQGPRNQILFSQLKSLEFFLFEKLNKFFCCLVRQINLVTSSYAYDIFFMIIVKVDHQYCLCYRLSSSLRNKWPRKIIRNFNFSKQYINYTTVLSDERDNILTFGLSGRIFHLNVLDDEEAISPLYLLTTLFIGLFAIFVIVKVFRLRE